MEVTVNMWIMYASIAVFVAALIMLGAALMKTLKTTRPIIYEMNQTVENIQLKINNVISEADQLQETQGEIKEDIDFKKNICIHTINEVKRTPKVTKEFIKNMKK